MRARRDDPDLGRRDDVAVVVEGHDRLDDDLGLAGGRGVAERAPPHVARREAPRRRRGRARLARAGDGRLEPRPHEREADEVRDDAAAVRAPGLRERRLAADERPVEERRLESARVVRPPARLRLEVLDAAEPAELGALRVVGGGRGGEHLVVRARPRKSLFSRVAPEKVLATRDAPQIAPLFRASLSCDHYAVPRADLCHKLRWLKGVGVFSPLLFKITSCPEVLQTQGPRAVSVLKNVVLDSIFEFLDQWS